MRTKSVSPFFTACLIGFLSLSGCLDITSTSKVNTDGSIVRTVTFKGDSAEVCEGKFPIVLDSSWTTQITRPSPTSRKDYTLTATRTFRNVEEMNKVLGGTFGRTLQYRFSLDKSFDWFFTVYRYTETSLPYAQYTSVPITDYLSLQEVALVTQDTLGDFDKRLPSTRGDSLAMENLIPREQEWEWRNRFEPVFSEFLVGVRSLNNSSLTPGMVESAKESLYKKSEYALDKGNIDSLRMIFKAVLKTPLVDKAWESNTQGIEEVRRRFDFEKLTRSHKYFTNVVMPGLITGSNAKKIEANTASWQDYNEFAHRFEYTMWVESRLVNWWAVIIAIVLVAAIVTTLLISAFRRRSQV
jgi:hypothetical protein